MQISKLIHSRQTKQTEIYQQSAHSLRYRLYGVMMAVGINTYPWVETKTALLLGLMIILLQGHKYLFSCGDRNSFIVDSLYYTHFSGFLKSIPTRKDSFRTWAILSLSHFFMMSVQADGFSLNSAGTLRQQRQPHFLD